MMRVVAALGILVAACATVPARSPVLAPALPLGAVELPTRDPASYRASAWTVPSTLALRPGIAGHVRDGRGAEQAGATLVVTEPAHPGPEQVQLADEHGAFAYPLAPGTYVLAVYLGEVTVVLDPLTTDRETTTELDLVIAPGPGGGEVLTIHAA